MLCLKQVFPWTIHLFVHTLTIAPASASVAIRRIVPARDRLPTALALVVTVPANTTALLSIEYATRLLRLHEYPPEAHRGAAVPAGVVCVGPCPCHPLLGRKTQLQPTTNDCMVLLSDPLLVPQPLPDFSMPFNVIMITSAAMAIWIIALAKLNAPMTVNEPKKDA